VRAIERLKHNVHQITPVKHKIFDKSFQLQKRQLLKQVETKATGPRSTFATKLAHMMTAAKGYIYGAVNMTTDKPVEFQVLLCDAETEATNRRIADTDRIVSQL